MAKSFSFSLEKIIDVRKNIENKKAVELNKSKIVLKKKQNELDKLKGEKEKAIHNTLFNNEKTDKLNINKLKINNDYLSQLNKNIESQKKNVNTSNKFVQENRNKLLFASKEKKVLEKLKEKAQLNYKKIKNMQENKAENEITIQMSGQKSHKI